MEPKLFQCNNRHEFVCLLEYTTGKCKHFTPHILRNGCKSLVCSLIYNHLKHNSRKCIVHCEEVEEH
jgi:hypothetical protein